MQKVINHQPSIIVLEVNKNIKSEQSNLPDGWFSVKETPPDELLQVVDINGNRGYAQPTWYPFIFRKNPNKIGKWTTDVVSCDPYWDGGWMVMCEGLTTEVSDIIGWKHIDKPTS